MTSLVLSTAGFVEHHTAEENTKRLVKILESQGVVSQVIGVVHDKAADLSALLFGRQRH